MEVDRNFYGIIKVFFFLKVANREREEKQWVYRVFSGEKPPIDFE